METLERNKAIVFRFNKEFVENGNDSVFNEIVDPKFVYHTDPQTAPEGRESYYHFFQGLLKPSINNLKVNIHDVVAEDDKVVTMKTYYGTLKTATSRSEEAGDIIEIVVMEIIRLKDGRFVECWNILDWKDVGMQAIMEEDTVY